jgi:hypothetical protein
MRTYNFTVEGQAFTIMAENFSAALDKLKQLLKT